MFFIEKDGIQGTLPTQRGEGRRYPSVAHTRNGLCVVYEPPRALQPPQRLPLFAKVFSHFFRWVWLSVIALLVTGFILLFGWFGGMKGAPIHVHLMLTLGLVMTLIYLFIFFVPYGRLKQEVAAQNWPKAGKALDTIRKLVVTNLTLGMVIVITTAAGRYLGL